MHLTLKELYNLKLYEYKTYGLREKPHRLLAMLLLSEMNKFKALRSSQGEFYKKYKNEIDEKISKVETDFQFTKEDIIEYIEETVICDDYPNQKIWFVFAEGFGALNWGLLYKNDETPDEIYSQYFDRDDLKRPYDLEQIAIARNIQTTRINELINKILTSPTDFYIKIYENLTEEERLFILNCLQNKECFSCQNKNCNLDQNQSCQNWTNPEIIGKSKLLRIYDIHKLI